MGCSAVVAVDTMVATPKPVGETAPSYYPAQPTGYIALCCVKEVEAAALLEQGLLHEAVAASFPLGSTSVSAPERPLPCTQALQEHIEEPCSKN